MLSEVKIKSPSKLEVTFCDLKFFSYFESFHLVITERTTQSSVKNLDTAMSSVQYLLQVMSFR